MDTLEALHGPEGAVLHGLLYPRRELPGHRVPSPRSHHSRSDQGCIPVALRDSDLPLARVVPQWKQREGGLGLVDIGLWFLVLFLHFNLGHWRDAAAKDRRCVGTGEVSEPWTRWGELWWNGGAPVWRLTASLKRELPDFMREAAATICRYNMDASLFRGDGREGADSAGSLYWQLFGRCKMDAYDEGIHLAPSLYLRHQQFPIPTFQDKTIPHALRDLRWRAYHQVLYVGAGRRGGEESLWHCRRASCTGGDTVETIPHAVRGCPAASRDWRAVAVVLKWPFLASQSWESIVSGLEPGEGFGQPRAMVHDGQPPALVARGPTRGAPWAMVRLVNLVVLSVVFKNRRAEMQTKRPTPPEETRNAVIAYLNKIRQWEKEHSKIISIGYVLVKVAP
ncbi:UNVERIFIED_CONTAM: hypothetical protein K2H54_039602 [Gekko kuhli]